VSGHHRKGHCTLVSKPPLEDAYEARKVSNLHRMRCCTLFSKTPLENAAAVAFMGSETVRTLEKEMSKSVREMILVNVPDSNIGFAWYVVRVMEV
jgi:hypothetical protein